jgi:hypothetical protein
VQHRRSVGEVNAVFFEVCRRLARVPCNCRRPSTSVYAHLCIPVNIVWSETENLYTIGPAESCGSVDCLRASLCEAREYRPRRFDSVKESQKREFFSVLLQHNWELATDISSVPQSGPRAAPFKTLTESSGIRATLSV